MRAVVPLPNALCVVALLCILAAPAGAEILRYEDEDGKVHFVSDLSQIPPRYRSRAQEAATGNINRVDEEAVEASEQAAKRRLKSLRRLNRSLDRSQQRRSAPERSARPPAADRSPGAEPRKYERDCDIINRNGRCGRRRTAEWDTWNRRRNEEDLRRTLSGND